MAIQNGYAGKILRVDLSTGRISTSPTSDYADRFVGGRGIAARIYWDEVKPETGAFDPENTLAFVTGPLGTHPAIGGSRWEVCGKSRLPTAERFCYNNLGGRWGAELKFAGYDAIIVKGKSDKPAYLLLQDGTVTLRDASALRDKGAIETRELLKSELGTQAKVVAIGPAGERQAIMANLLSDQDSSGSGGMGAVMGSKKLKAIVVRGGNRSIRVANDARFQELLTYFRQIYRRVHPKLIAGMPLAASGPRAKKDVCYGCVGCYRVTHQADDGRVGKFMCHPAMFYYASARAYYGQTNDVPFSAAKLCDNYGIDTLAVDVLIYWLSRCHKAGVLTEKSTGIPISKLGSLEFIETLTRKIALREGFGDILAQGVVKAAEMVGPAAQEQLTDYLSKPGDGFTYYSPRLFITTGLLHAMEPRMPMHQLHQARTLPGRWLEWMNKAEGSYMSTEMLQEASKNVYGSEEAVDFSTYEGKALASKKIQDRQYAQELLILCDFMWPNTDIAHLKQLGPTDLESKFLSAVTGREIDENGLYQLGERVFNLQRAILAREGHRGRQFDSLPESWFTSPLKHEPVLRDCQAPGRNGELLQRKGTVVDRAGFEKIKDEYYALRGWDVATGLQTRAELKEIGLSDIIPGLDQAGLVI